MQGLTRFPTENCLCAVQTLVRITAIRQTCRAYLTGLSGIYCCPCGQD